MRGDVEPPPKQWPQCLFGHLIKFPRIILFFLFVSLILLYFYYICIIIMYCCCCYYYFCNYDFCVEKFFSCRSVFNAPPNCRSYNLQTNLQTTVPSYFLPKRPHMCFAGKTAIPEDLSGSCVIRIRQYSWHLDFLRSDDLICFFFASSRCFSEKVKLNEEDPAPTAMKRRCTAAWNRGGSLL